MSHKRQIYKASELRNLQKDENSCVSIVPITRRLAIPPSFLNDMKSGIFYFLKSILKKYDRELDGILLGYQNVKVLFDENTGIVQMGKAETEVNVSVEFFIFQPKIGSCLEGIVNKKSNNHISCLVHKYFNATILKPEDVEFEDWICKDFEINDKITFRVKDLDFTRLLPYIEGIVDKDLLVKCQINKKNKKINFNSENESDVSTSEKEKNQSKQLGKEESSFVNNYDGEKVDEIDAVVKKKKKKKNSVQNFNEFNEKTSKEEELNMDISSSTEKDEKVYKEKKKKRKKENRGEECENEAFDKTEPLIQEKMTVENNQELEVNDEYSKNDVKVKKKKKKDKKEKEEVKLESKDEKTVNENPVEKGDLSFLYSTQIQPTTTVSKLEMTFCSPIPREPTATKKKNKKEKKKEKELFKTIISTSQVNDLVDEEKEKSLKKSEKRKRKESGHSEEEKSSQQNENKSVNKDGCDVSLEKKKDKKEKKKEKELFKTIISTSQVNDLVDEEKEKSLKKSEKRKRKESGHSEEEKSLQENENKSVNKDGCDVSLEKKKDKKVSKTMSSNSEGDGFVDKNKDVGKDNSLRYNEGSDVSPRKKMKISECKDNETREGSISKNMSVEKSKPEVNPTLDKNKSVDKEDGETANKSLTDTSPKKKEKSAKESPKKSIPKSNEVKNDKPKSKVQTLLDELLQNQITKVKEQWKTLESRSSESERDVKSDGKEHKKKSKEKKRSLHGEKESNQSEFLYEKLLKDAKSALCSTQRTDENKSQPSSDEKTLKPSNESKETGEKSTESQTKKESSKVEHLTEKKGKKRKRKESEVEEPQSKKFKNGSMYDFESSPEKGAKEDKSLFSDSESNMTEKNIPRLNGHLSESEKEENTNLLKEKEKSKKTSETPRGEEEVEKKGKSKSGKKKKKSKEKTEESLYEKLLRDAKSLINSRSEEVPVVENKTEKKIRTIDSYFKPA